MNFALNCSELKTDTWNRLHDYLTAQLRPGLLSQEEFFARGMPLADYRRIVMRTPANGPGKNMGRLAREIRDYLELEPGPAPHDRVTLEFVAWECSQHPAYTPHG